MRTLITLCIILSLTACTDNDRVDQQPNIKNQSFLLYKNDENGNVLVGSKSALISAIRQGCNIRIGWGAQSKTDPKRSIEHVSTPKWIAVHSGNTVRVQLDEHLINLAEIDVKDSKHADKLVMWRVSLSTDGDFNAIWYDRVTGELLERRPQTHIMSWFSNCLQEPAEPLFKK